MAKYSPNRRELIQNKAGDFYAKRRADGTFKSPGELGALFKAVGIDVNRPVVNSCGSGVTASMLALALAVLGQTNAAVYDGSWAEWGQDGTGLPVETGPAR